MKHVHLTAHLRGGEHAEFCMLEHGGWTVNHTIQAIVIGHGVPRVQVPLISVNFLSVDPGPEWCTNTEDVHADEYHDLPAHTDVKAQTRHLSVVPPAFDGLSPEEDEAFSRVAWPVYGPYQKPVDGQALELVWRTYFQDTVDVEFTDADRILLALVQAFAAGLPKEDRPAFGGDSVEQCPVTNGEYDCQLADGHLEWDPPSPHLFPDDPIVDDEDPVQDVPIGAPRRGLGRGLSSLIPNGPVEP